VSSTTSGSCSTCSGAQCRCKDRGVRSVPW
jgi:hypothetical protein